MTIPKNLSIAVEQAADIIPRLGSPIHWKQGRSAKALADSWTQAESLPPAIAEILRGTPEYADSQLVEAWFERKTELPDRQGRPSQTDLLALITARDGLAVLAIEGKVDEPFGQSVQDWLGPDRPETKLRRLEGLCDALGLRSKPVGDLRYQLLHRTVAAILEARRFRTPSAVLLIQSFCPNTTGFADFRRFAERLGYASVEPGTVTEPKEVAGVVLRLGWVSDQVPPGKDPPSVAWLTELGRTRLSKHFFMREFLHSEIAAIHGLPNIPRDPELAIAAGEQLCSELLEPLQEKFGRVVVRSAYRSPEVNGMGASMQRRGAKAYSCASNESNSAAHIWDVLDQTGAMGATACVVIPTVYDLFKHEEAGWQRLAWWIHDHLPYSTLTFFPRDWAFNIQWHERPQRRIDSHVAPLGTLTQPGFDNNLGDHRKQWSALDNAFGRGER